MRNIFGYAIACAVFGSLVPSTAAAGLFGSLLGDDNSNNNDPSIPLIGSLGIGSNRNEKIRLNNNYNQHANNNNQYTNNNNNEYLNDNNVNRGLLSVLGVNANVNIPNNNNIENVNRVSNTGQNNPSNVNAIKNQMKEAEKLLERLKELNRLKEQQKLEKENSQGQMHPDTDKEKQRTDNNNVNMNSDGEKNKSNVLRSLTKKKFYFMVKPVLPENEESNQEQTVYYTD